jgi:hypothetical protein
MHEDVLPLEGVFPNEEIELVVEHPRGEGCEALGGWYSVRCNTVRIILSFDENKEDEVKL